MLFSSFLHFVKLLCDFGEEAKHQSLLRCRLCCCGYAEHVLIRKYVLFCLIDLYSFAFLHKTVAAEHEFQKAFAYRADGFLIHRGHIGKLGILAGEGGDFFFVHNFWFWGKSLNRRQISLPNLVASSSVALKST